MNRARGVSGSWLAGISQSIVLWKCAILEMTVVPHALQWVWIIRQTIVPCLISDRCRRNAQVDDFDGDQWLSEQHNNNNARIAGNNACSNFNNNNVNNDNRFRAVFRP
ncbi:MAG: hypothetical protein ABIH23_02715 [bacterium]